MLPALFIYSSRYLLYLLTLCPLVISSRLRSDVRCPDVVEALVDSPRLMARHVLFATLLLSGAGGLHY